MTRSSTYQIHIDEIDSDAITPISSYPANSVPYHLSTDNFMYTLAYATGDRTRAIDQAKTREDESTTSGIVSFNHLATPFYGIYTTSTQTDYGTTNLSTITAENTRVLVNAFISIFGNVMSHSNSDWHKPVNVASAGETIDTIQWKQPVCSVGGELLSSLILTHSLPNTNHRSSIAFTGLYLSTIHDDFSFPDTLSENPQLHDWTNTFIIDSKRILTTRRNAGLFQWLANHNIDTVSRKNGILISLNNYDLENPDIQDRLTMQHEQLCIDYISDIVVESQTENVSEVTDPGKSVFADRVAATTTECFEELGAAVAQFRD